MKMRTAKKQTDTSAALCNDKEFNALLSKYQDRELDLVTQEKVAAHVNSCGACREELALLERVTLEIKTLSEVDTPQNFNAVLMDKVIGKQEQVSRWSFGFSFPSVVYSIVFIVFLALGFWMKGELTMKVDLAESQIAANEIVLEQLSRDNQLTGLLGESQGLSLIQVQEQTLALLTMNDTDNGEYYEQ